MRPSPRPGDRLGRYELVGLIGRGGMAEAWEGRWLGEAGVSRPVLIKRVLPEFVGDERFLAMFIAEAQISATLSHGNIAQVYDFGRIGDEYFLAMEFVDGVPLHRVLRSARRAGYPVLPLTVSLFIATEICRGLHYAHTRTDADGNPLGIVHRDISPDNILLSWEGQVKVVDFGIAKARMLRGFKTQAGVLKGKILYFSPEQAQGVEIDARTDVWATGIVLYELLCGGHPFEGGQLQALRRITEGRFTPPRELRPDLPENVEAILLKALALDPEDRWPSCHALGDALSEALFSVAPRFSGMNLAWLLKTLFKSELEARSDDTRVPQSFLDELSIWKTGVPTTGPNVSGSGAGSASGSDAQKTASLRKPQPAAPEKPRRLLVPAVAAVGGVLAIGVLALALREAPSPSPAPLDPFVLSPASTPPPEVPAEAPTPPLQAVNEPPRFYQWPVEAMLVDAARNRILVQPGVLPTFEGPEAGDFVATELPRLQNAPPIFALGIRREDEEIHPLGSVLRLAGVRSIVFFSLGGVRDGAGGLKRTIRVEGANLPQAFKLTLVPAADSPDLGRTVELAGLEPRARYQLTLIPHEGHPLRGTVMCVRGAAQAPGRGDGFVLRADGPIELEGEHAIRCGVISTGVREPQGDALVRIAEVRAPTTASASSQPSGAPQPSGFQDGPAGLAAALLEQADTAMKHRDYDAARIAAKKCTKVAPSVARCHYMFGKAQDGLGALDKAEKAFKTFLELDPDSKEAPAVRKLLAKYARERDVEERP